MGGLGDYYVRITSCVRDSRGDVEGLNEIHDGVSISGRVQWREDVAQRQILYRGIPTCRPASGVQSALDGLDGRSDGSDKQMCTRARCPPTTARTSEESRGVQIL